VLGREVEDDAMVSLAQKRFAGCLGSEHAGLTFDAEVAVEAAMLRNKANDGLGEMDVEVVADPTVCWRRRCSAKCRENVQSPGARPGACRAVAPGRIAAHKKSHSTVSQSEGARHCG
jgi:hypothetical protein